MIMLAGLKQVGQYPQAARHPKVDQQGSGFSAQQQIFAAALHVENFLTG